MPERGLERNEASSEANPPHDVARLRAPQRSEWREWITPLGLEVVPEVNRTIRGAAFSGSAQLPVEPVAARSSLKLTIRRPCSSALRAVASCPGITKRRGSVMATACATSDGPHRRSRVTATAEERRTAKVATTPMKLLGQISTTASPGSTPAARRA